MNLPTLCVTPGLLHKIGLLSYFLVLNFPCLFYVLRFTFFIGLTWRCIAINAATPRNPHAVIFIKQKVEENFRASCSITCCKNVASREVPFFWKFVTIQHLRTYNWVLLMSLQPQKLWRLTCFQARLHSSVKLWLELCCMSVCLYV